MLVSVRIAADILMILLLVIVSNVLIAVKNMPLQPAEQVTQTLRSSAITQLTARENLSAKVVNCIAHYKHYRRRIQKVAHILFPDEYIE